ncbi:MAG: S9 family peptidase [Firmicutes bacterium]|nr:S9 family peptidase [Bacillota bacterium]
MWLALPGLQAGSKALSQTGKQLTVERIYGQPSLSGSLTSGVQWRPDGKVLTYLERRGQGAQAEMELWALDMESGARSVLVSAETMRNLLLPRGAPEAQRTGLGRQTPQRYFWSPTGEGLLFAAPQALYWYDLNSRTAKQLTSSHATMTDPKVSPDGRWVSFVRDHDLWLVETATGQERRLTQGGREELRNAELDWVYPEELGIRTAYWWSPDASRMAFLQMDQRPVTRYPLVDLLSYTGETEWMRYPKAGDANPIVRVGVVSLVGGEPRWIDLGPETDMYIPRVHWMPDGKRVAIQRLNRNQTRLELLIAEADSGRSRVLLVEEDPHWINLHDDLYFFSDGKRFLWSSERSGYRHLYLYGMDGNLIRQLTQGEWEVSGLSGVDETSGWVYFVATEKSPLERHLYRVRVDGSGFARITEAEGTHGINLAPTAAYFLDTYSNTMTPPRQDLYRADGTRLHVLNENRVAELTEYRLQPVEFLTLRAADGTVLYAMMIKPAEFDATRKYPVLLHLYGGPHGQVVRKAWGGANFLWHQMMAQKGFLIFILDNRGMAGRGHVFETPIHQRLGEVELADQLAGVEYLKSLPYVDGGRIGIWGWSYGGYMTLYAMFNAPEIFQAGFAGAPVTDWRQYDTIYTERYLKRPQENPEGYRRSSPVNQAGHLKGKLLIAHGTADDNVHYANTVQLQEQLIRHGRYAEILVYPGRGHGISDARARIHLFHRVTQFFEETLRRDEP